jgi:2-amino-4,5-dihydroxy-6-oxo-7-(phosphonooxy)heptanoate synthase
MPEDVMATDAHMAHDPTIFTDSQVVPFYERRNIMDSGKRLRFNRLMHRRGAHHEGQGLFLVPLDHSVAQGPLTSSDGFGRIVDDVGRNGADGIIVHKGRVRFLGGALPTDLALVIHLSASTCHAPDTDHKVLVTGVEQALRYGADAVSVHVNLGSESEAHQLADLGRVADACAQWGIPLIAMIYPRGPRISDGSDPELVAHAASLAADLGADVVKTPYTGAVETMREVVRSCPIPLLTAGGEKAASETALYASIEDVMSAGVAGVAMGRNVFEARDVPGVTQRIARIVHRPRPQRRSDDVKDHDGVIPIRSIQSS